MITSRLTNKAQTTIPKSVRSALGLREGDTVEYEIHEGVVTIRKAVPKGGDDPFATFDEWNSEADRHAYADL